MGQTDPVGSEVESEDRMVDLLPEDDGKNGLGIIFFFKWEEDREHFPPEFMEYMTQLDEGRHVDYGQVLKSDISDMDELTLLKKISNYSQAVNNSLFDLGIQPPFYYLAVPLLNRSYAQEICDMIRDTYKLQSIFFTYPQ